MNPDPSGQLAELVVNITSTRVDLYSHQILFLFKKSIGNVVCKTEAILSRSQCVNNDNVVHSSHSGLNINDGGLWIVTI